MPIHLHRAPLLFAAFAITLARLSAVEISDQNALIATLRAGESEAAIALLHSDLPINQPVSRDNTTLLHLAARSGLPRVINRMLDLGASPLARDNRGRSALHYLAEAKTASPAALRSLLETGSLVVDDLDSTGRTPLSFAVARGDILAATALFEAGADPLAGSLDGVTPLAIAEQKRHTGLLDLFRGTTYAAPAPPSDTRRESYPAPDLSVPLFARSSLTLPLKTLTALNENLATLGHNFQKSPLVDHDLRARALAVALSIDRRYRPAVVADAQLRRGQTPTPLPSSSTPLRLASEFRDFGRRLSPPTSSPDDLRLAALLVDIASRIDPSVSTVGFPAPDWSPAFPVTGTPPPHSPTSRVAAVPPLPVAHASIRTVTLTSGATTEPPIFSTVDLSSTALPRPPHAPSTAARFTTPNTGDLTGAITASKTLHPWPRGHQIILSLPPNTSPADARTAGLATSLLIASHCSSRPLDPNIAVVAGVSKTGHLTGISDLDARLRTAINSGCKTVILPASAAAEITDAVTLGDTGIVRDIQIYTATDLASAFAIATASPPYAHASTEFLLVQALTKSGRLSSGEAISRLRQIAASTPGHLSASLLVAAASGTLPKQLSPPTSAAKVRILANRLIGPIDPKRGYPHPAQYQTEILDAIRSALTRHRPMLAPQTRPAADATTDLATLISKYHHAPPRSGDGKRKMTIALKTATAELVSKLDELVALDPPLNSP